MSTKSNPNPKKLGDVDTSAPLTADQLDAIFKVSKMYNQDIEDPAEMTEQSFLGAMALLEIYGVITPIQTRLIAHLVPGIRDQIMDRVLEEQEAEAAIEAAENEGLQGTA